ncbi:MAG: sensor histidine kinase [Anaerolineales bacterium]|nr:sensor histidine kinase [Anaerolineales bacterium]MCX7608671.1 sensor histidine kinase [Anaerolineales bacterium]
MQLSPFFFVYFIYGLAFFSMGLVVLMEVGRTLDRRLQKALRPLAGFGLLHALHEWLAMYGYLLECAGSLEPPVLLTGRLIILAFSFVTLSAFGGYLLAYSPQSQRLALLVPFGIETIWVLGLFWLASQYPSDSLLAVGEVWTRYSLALPASLVAALGLMAQQRAFRRAGLIAFGQDALWAAIAFTWYGIIGQLFTAVSPLPPSTWLNENLFESLFGFPVQAFRALTALAASIFVMRFLRASRVEIERKIHELNQARLQEIAQREALKSELFRRVVEAQEAERQRIARDLHDEIGQTLTAISLGLRSLENISLEKNEKLSRRLNDLQELAANSLKELQRLIADLRPSHLDDLGLPAALRWYIGRLTEHADLQIHLEMRGEEREICPEYATSVFRILQEALTNIVRHAQASRANILLDFQEEKIHIVVSDNGIGFDPRKLSNSWGLTGMQERASLLNGQMEIESSPGKGTIIRITIPYCPEHLQRKGSK